MNDKEKLCRMKLDIAFYLKGDTSELSSNKDFDKLICSIEKALTGIVADIKYDDDFEVLD